MTLDPDVRQILAGKLSVVTADERGRIVSTGPSLERYAVLGPVPLPVSLHGRTHHFQWYTYARVPSDLPTDQLTPDVLMHRMAASEDIANSVLVLGDLPRADAPLIRMHSCCATGEIFGSQRCECGPQLRRAQQMVADEGVGAIVYLADHEGRGIGLFAKAAAYLLQDKGLDTFEANRKLGFPDDCRNFAEAAFIIHHLRGAGRTIRLISNNPDKRRALEAGGVKVAGMVPLIMGLSPHNQRYIQTKRAYGHLFGELEVAGDDEVQDHGAVRSTAVGL